MGSEGKGGIFMQPCPENSVNVLCVVGVVTLQASPRDKGTLFYKSSGQQG